MGATSSTTSTAPATPTPQAHSVTPVVKEPTTSAQSTSSTDRIESTAPTLPPPSHPGVKMQNTARSYASSASVYGPPSGSLSLPAPESSPISTLGDFEDFLSSLSTEKDRKAFLQDLLILSSTQINSQQQVRFEKLNLLQRILEDLYLKTFHSNRQAWANFFGDTLKNPEGIKEFIFDTAVRIANNSSLTVAQALPDLFEKLSSLSVGYDSQLFVLRYMDYGSPDDEAGLNHLRAQAVQFHSDLQNYGAVYQIAQEALAEEFKGAIKEITAQDPDALTDATDEAKQKIKDLTEKYHAQWVDQGMKVADIQGMTDALVQDEIHDLLLKAALKNNKLNPNTLISDKRAIWDVYADCFDPFDEYFNMQEANFDFMVEEICINAPLILASGAVASIGRVIVTESLAIAVDAARAFPALTRFVTGAARVGGTVLRNGVVEEGAFFFAKRVTVGSLSSSVVGGLLEGTFFEMAHHGVQGQWLFSAPDCLQQILWSSVALGLFKESGKFGKVAADARKLEVVMAKFRLPDAVKTGIKELVIKGHFEVATMLLIAAVQNKYYGGTLKEFFDAFPEELFHAYVTAYSLKGAGKVTEAALHLAKMVEDWKRARNAARAAATRPAPTPVTSPAVDPVQSRINAARDCNERARSENPEVRKEAFRTLRGMQTDEDPRVRLAVAQIYRDMVVDGQNANQALGYLAEMRADSSLEVCRVVVETCGRCISGDNAFVALNVLSVMAYNSNSEICSVAIRACVEIARWTLDSQVREHALNILEARAASDPSQTDVVREMVIEADSAILRRLKTSSSSDQSPTAADRIRAAEVCGEILSQSANRNIVDKVFVILEQRNMNQAPESEVRLAVAKALNRLPAGSPDVDLSMLSAMKADPNDAVRLEVARGFARQIQGIHRQEAFNELMSMRGDSNPEVIQVVIDVLARLQESSDPAIRVIIVRAYGDMVCEKGLPTKEQNLEGQILLQLDYMKNDSDPAVQKEVVEAYAKHQYVEGLRGLLKPGTSSLIRCEVARACGRIVNNTSDATVRSGALRLLGIMEYASNPVERAAVAYAYGDMVCERGSREERQILDGLELLRHAPEAEVRVAASRALGKHHNVAELSNMRNDSDPQVRAGVAEGLGYCGEAGLAILNLMQQNHIALDSPASTPRPGRVVGELDPVVLKAIAKSCGEIGGADALTILERMATDQFDNSVLDTIAAACQKIMDSDATRACKDRAKEIKDKAVHGKSVSR